MTDSEYDLLNEYNLTQAGKCKAADAIKSSGTPGAYVPALRPDHAALYRTLLFANKPKKILEAGTLFGYSSVLAAEVLSEIHGGDFRIDTVEIDRDNASEAAKNIRGAGFADRIRVIEGDACEVFSCLEGPYDLIFLDCSKSSYNAMLDDVKRLLKKGGLLLADDVGYHGKLDGDENGAVPRKHRTIVNALRAFMSRVSGDDDFASFADAMDDGMLVAVKK
ncbi:MAG: class I SAM-dependent methyltransferase [Clostridia bacterium]|nr:class I SAM-dependent methyltransferase [Clostridia bacterium]